MIAEEGTYPAGCEVLLLEDDPPLRRRLAAHLRTLKAEVTEASTIEEARRILRDLRFDFALVDLHLPDGCTTAAVIHESSVLPAGSTAPLVSGDELILVMREGAVCDVQTLAT